MGTRAERAAGDDEQCASSAASAQAAFTRPSDVAVARAPSALSGTIAEADLVADRDR